jgi:hypothetical protein
LTASPARARRATRRHENEARRRHPDLKVLFTTGYAQNAIVHYGRLDPASS